MRTLITTSASMVNYLGFNDESGTVKIAEKEQIPQFLIKAFLMTPMGTTDAVITDGAGAKGLFGETCLDVGTKYYTHQTQYARRAFEKSRVMVKRVIPADAKEANLTLLAIVEEGKANLPKRNSDGSVLKDVDGNDILSDTEADMLGVTYAVTKDVVEDVIEVADGVKAYPIIMVPAAYAGATYNEFGISIGSPHFSALTPRVYTKDQALPFDITLYRKGAVKAKKISTLSANKFIRATFRKGTTDVFARTPNDFSSVLMHQYFNTTDPSMAGRAPYFKLPILNEKSIGKFLSALVAAEAPFVTDEQQEWEDGLQAATKEWFDYPEDLTDDYKYLIDFISFHSKNKTPYMAIRQGDFGLYEATDKVYGSTIDMSTNTPIFLDGGEDGDVSYENYEKLVQAELMAYGDEMSEIHDMAYNVESTLVDSGFSQPIKEIFYKALVIRPDTNIFFSLDYPTDADDYRMTNNDIQNRARLIMNNLKVVPESVYYGTGVTRAVITGGNARTHGLSPRRISPNYSLIGKLTEYMGAGDYRWKAGKRIDATPGSHIHDMYDFSPTFIPDVIKNTMVDLQVNIPERYNRTIYQFPSYQTVYDDDTSVLNSVISMLGACTLTKIAGKAQREFRGSTRLSRGELKGKIEDFVLEETAGIFDESFIVVPEVTFTKVDLSQGFSWHLNIYLDGKPFYSSQTVTITAINSANKGGN